MLIILYIIINPQIILIIIKIFRKNNHKSNNYNKLNKNSNNFIIVNSTKGRIFYCTTYNNEAEILYTLIWRLYDYVDKFIIVISNRTYSGKPKNFTLKSFEENIKQYNDKIDFVNYDNICNKKEYPRDNDIWCREKCQRDYAKYYIESKYNPTEKDLLIVVDLDEIVTREGIQYIKNNPPKEIKHIQGSLYFPYYYHKIGNWNLGFVVRYNKNMKTLSRCRGIGTEENNIIRYEYNPSKPLITHCSYCFKNIEEYKNKLMSYSHKEFNKPPYITNDWIFKSHYCREKIVYHPGNDEPYEGWRHLIPDDERLKNLFDRSYMYNISQTSYTEKDLENLCNRIFNRTPFE